ncbi:uncharacterized protein MONOS_13777 [Monocercomonoides exilis]|uniref:uncharacterized protein n=1 Tax=Monocercomonoides exilis TaxID=2049356 RepID=UPI0035595D83|nr:hypothetical protein MONOS_13777 [Monocercomonoides exilis]|eukprot:MONOS_13777.1-p1 / transcript=MONOS_13777.1 / gene=MONOS_13777 / organism=Monocercomonoides_exilis_PA203 / gene_product=unspecified product / transcript_product=unspecified product / location=Mono_scaffold00882:746-2297(+) / protein_length=390 / sequence_SO=supercontig / SO=protein_coding / is_pseudo=false
MRRISRFDHIGEEEEEEEEEEEVEEEEYYDSDYYFYCDDEGEEDCDEEKEEFKTELTEKFTKLLDELEDCDGNEQKQNIEEMNGLMDELCEEEFRSVFTINNFDKIEKMIEEKKLTLENTMMLMKHIAYCNALAEGLKKKLYLKEIEEIVKYHQEHHNLTQIAYQIVWRFIITQFKIDYSLENVIVNELHFAREATRELNELSKCVDWKRKEEEEGEKKTEEENRMKRWIRTLGFFNQSCALWNNEFIGLIGSIVQVFQAAKKNHRESCKECIFLFRNAAKSRAVKVEAFLKSGAIDVVLEEMKRSTLEDEVANEIFHFFLNVSRKLKEKNKDEKEEEERKSIKKEVFEKMEEEGYEDTIVSFRKKLSFLYQDYNYELSLDISDYFVNA